MKLEDFLEPLDPKTAGTIPIQEEFTHLKDQDLAQRLSTDIFGLTMSLEGKSDPRSKVEILEELNYMMGDKVHGVVALRVDSMGPSGPYTYTKLVCSHELLFTEDERFLDEEGNPIYSGLSTLYSNKKCGFLAAAQHLRQLQVVAAHSEEIGDSPENFLEWSDYTRLKDFIVELTDRFYRGEWIGPDPSGSLYVQQLADMLDRSFGEISDAVSVLVEEERIARNGNIVYSIKDSVENPKENQPTRLWARFHQSLGASYSLNADVYLPANRGELPRAKFIFSLFGEVKAVRSYRLLDHLSPEGAPSDLDYETMQNLLVRWASDLNRSIVTSDQGTLTLVENSILFDPSGVDPSLPSSLFKTHELSPDSAVSVYLPASEQENHEAVLVTHRLGVAQTPAETPAAHLRRIPLYHPIAFGLDAEDLDNIENAITALRYELIDGGGW